MQYHEHHMERNRRRAARQESNASTTASDISPSGNANAPMVGPVSGDPTEADPKPPHEAKRTRGVERVPKQSKVNDRGSLGAMPDNVMFPRNTGRFEIFEAYEFFTMVEACRAPKRTRGSSTPSMMRSRCARSCRRS